MPVSQTGLKQGCSRIMPGLPSASGSSSSMNSSTSLGPADQRMLPVVTGRHQDDLPVDHRREDRPDAVGRGLAVLTRPVLDPVEGPVDRPTSPRRAAEAVQELQTAIDRGEEPPPSGRDLVLHGEAMTLALVEVELVDRLRLRETAGRPQRHHEGERQDHRPRPRRDLVEVEVEPPRQHHDLGRNRGDRVPGDLSETREEEVRPGVDPLGPAELVDPLAGRRHVRGLRRVAVELEDEVALDRRGEVDARAGELAPAAVLPLLRSKLVDDAIEHLGAAAVGERGRLLAEDPLHEQVLALQDRVALEFRAPVAVGVLLARAASIDRPTAASATASSGVSSRDSAVGLGG